MRRALILVVLGLTFVEATGANLVANGEFDVGLAPWQPASGTSWLATSGSPSLGAAKMITTSADQPGTSFAGLSQCITLTGPTKLEFKVRLQESVDDLVSAGYNFWSGANCSGNGLGAAFRHKGEFSGVANAQVELLDDGWTLLRWESDIPAGTNSVRMTIDIPFTGPGEALVDAIELTVPDPLFASSFEE